MSMVSEGFAESVLPRVMQGMLTFVTPYDFKMQLFMISVLTCFLKLEK